MDNTAQTLTPPSTNPTTTAETKPRPIEIYRISNRQSAFYNERFELVERIRYRDGTESLWLTSANDPTLPTMSFSAKDTELLEIL